MNTQQSHGMQSKNSKQNTSEVFEPGRGVLPAGRGGRIRKKMAKKKDKKQCWCKGCCNNWCETYEFYGIKNYTWNKCWAGAKKNGFGSQLYKEWGMLNKAVSTGKLSYTRLVGESIVWLAVVYGIGCLIGKLIAWIVL